MDLSSAIRFSARQVSSELFSAGSIFSVYSLATSFALGFAALAYRRLRRRGRANLRVVSRAILSKHFARRESVHADLKLFALSVIFMPAVVGGLVISSNTVAKGVHTVLDGLFGAMSDPALPALQIKIISTLILFLAYEIGYFVDHYLKHRVSFLWELHKLHHTADALTPLTNFRNHPIDNIVFGYMLAIFIGRRVGFSALAVQQAGGNFRRRRKKHPLSLLSLDDRPSPAFAILDSLYGRMGPHLSEPRPSSNPSFKGPRAFQPQPWQRSRGVGLDVWNAGNAFGEKPSLDLRRRMKKASIRTPRPECC